MSTASTKTSILDFLRELTAATEKNRPLHALLLLCVVLSGTFMWTLHYTESALPEAALRSASPCVQEQLRAELDSSSEPVTRSDLDAAKKACATADAAEAQRQALKVEG
jgi:hypothetical protein